MRFMRFLLAFFILLISFAIVCNNKVEAMQAAMREAEQQELRESRMDLMRRYAEENGQAGHAGSPTTPTSDARVNQESQPSSVVDTQNVEQLPDQPSEETPGAASSSQRGTGPIWNPTARFDHPQYSSQPGAPARATRAAQPPRQPDQAAPSIQLGEMNRRGDPSVNSPHPSVRCYQEILLLLFPLTPVTRCDPLCIQIAWEGHGGPTWNPSARFDHPQYGGPQPQGPPTSRAQNMWSALRGSRRPRQL